ncbi:neuroepithelial cell-transforming gene 1 protein-like [Toxotes jaculatrix]|uniref:neuroepithelial cell-transforming gene 1 protein-like n=1 Tax=Toxotes jaculatrix TaxID=941984 RepID=UPI001B3AB0A5|nr:neuroepithelial cell-transforming gene 1 protein-like [Toxotes jaculatrix]
MGETGEVQAPVSDSEKPKRQPSSRNLKRKFSAEEESPPENNSRSVRRSLRRGSSFTFLTPGPQWDFSLKRKRREKDDSDAVSLCSFDFKVKHIG